MNSNGQDLLEMEFLAGEYYDAGKLDLAAAKYEELLKAVPNYEHGYVHLRLAHIYVELGSGANALVTLERIVDRSHISNEAFLECKALALIESARIDEAMDVLVKLVGEEQIYVGFLNMIARLLIRATETVDISLEELRSKVLDRQNDMDKVWNEIFDICQSLLSRGIWFLKKGLYSSDEATKVGIFDQAPSRHNQDACSVIA